jgi:hypothetical protein
LWGTLETIRSNFFLYWRTSFNPKKTFGIRGSLMRPVI